MRRASELVFAMLALGGCMKIYPDPELPDVDVEWYELDCRTDGNVVLSLVGLDDPSFRADLTVPCMDLAASFDDVPRQRYLLEAALLEPGGQEFSTYQEELDLRHGLDERAYLYFGGGFNNVRVAWAFDMGASCASLAVDLVLVQFSTTAFPDPIQFSHFCEGSPFLGSIPAGLYTIVVRAIAGETTVAVSPPSPEIAVTFNGLADAGTLVLSPCGATCP